MQSSEEMGVWCLCLVVVVVVVEMLPRICCLLPTTIKLVSYVAVVIQAVCPCVHSRVYVCVSAQM